MFNFKITLNRLIALNTIVFMLFLIFVSKFLYDKDHIILDEQIVKNLKTVKKEIEYNIQQFAKSNSIDDLQAYFDRKMVVNGIIKSISLIKDNKVIISTDKTKVNNLQNTIEKDITMRDLAHTTTICNNLYLYNNGVKTNYHLMLEIDRKFFQKLHDDLLFNTLTHVFIISLGFFILQALIYIFFIFNPLKKLIKSVKEENFEDTNYTLQEFNMLNQEFIDYSNAINELNRTLEEKVKSEISKRVENEKILIEQSQYLSAKNLITNISHHWRQPLNLITLVLENLKEALHEHHVNDEKVLKYLSVLSDTSFELSNTINKFSLYLNENSKNSLFNVKDSVEKVQFLIEENLKAHDITLKVEIEKNCFVYGRDLYLKNSLVSIIDNAKDAILEKLKIVEFIPFIKISVKTIEDDIIIDIENNGLSIQEDDRNKLFEPYYTTKFKSKGVGLNLFLSKLSIEKELQGFLYLYQTTPTTIFRIKLPLNNHL
ncbi:MAG: HAMP domain-containing histidine kinase [Campylobacterales bacterium]|nr:HAMP domain-containing histidine kinase [Campylobacterales bacterium]